jgi:L-lactate dehydrogenase (cytochrome)
MTDHPAEASAPLDALTSGLAEYQNEVYLHGLASEVPAWPMDAASLESKAYEQMTPEAVGYVAGGAGSESTVRANRDGFEAWRIVPDMLRGVEARDLSTTLLGTRMPAPVMLGPVGVQSIIHPDAECASARAAASLGVPWVLSTASSLPIEEVARAADEVRPGSPRWFQLYWPRNRDLAASFVHRAEAAGYTAIVFTLDTWMLGWRPRDLVRAYLPFLQGIGIANYTSDPVFRAALPDDKPESAILQWAQVFADPSLTWDDIVWLRDQTSLPLILKGICSPSDARRAVDAGVDALVVSNHGGRQVDGAVAAIDALPTVVDALESVGSAGQRMPVLFDSGIRCGADAIKALALGASAVLLGRLFTWGLALGGEEGVRHVLRVFMADLDSTMALSGHARPAELSREMLVRSR